MTAREVVAEALANRLAEVAYPNALRHNVEVRNVVDAEAGELTKSVLSALSAAGYVLVGAGTDSTGFAAVAVLTQYGIEVKRLAQVWDLDAMGRPFQTLWRIELARAIPERSDDWLMFVWGYQSQPDRAASCVLPEEGEKP